MSKVTRLHLHVHIHLPLIDYSSRSVPPIITQLPWRVCCCQCTGLAPNQPLEEGMPQSVSRRVIHALLKSWALIDAKDMESYKSMHELISSSNNRAAYRALLSSVQTKLNDGKFALSKSSHTTSSRSLAYNHQDSRRAAKMCVPYLGIYLSDLLFTEDGNKDYVEHHLPSGPAKRLINFTKFRRFAC